LPLAKFQTGRELKKETNAWRVQKGRGSSAVWTFGHTELQIAATRNPQP